jgi:hypothetical protein
MCMTGLSLPRFARRRAVAVSVVVLDDLAQMRPVAAGHLLLVSWANLAARRARGASGRARRVFLQRLEDLRVRSSWLARLVAHTGSNYVAHLPQIEYSDFKELKSFSREPEVDFGVSFF